LQLVRPDIRQSCILLAAVKSRASHKPTANITAAINNPAIAPRRTRQPRTKYERCATSEACVRFETLAASVDERLVLGFDPRDPFYRIVVEAHNSVHKLSVESHYMSCKSGVSRPERK
jgi:hypothetical protein